MENLGKYLTGYGIRPSVQRIAIMRYLRKNRTHPTADEVYEALKKQIPTLSKTTVYNTLKLFVDNGAAIFVGIDEKQARFDGYTEQHAHFRCKKCKCVLDIPMDTHKLLPANFNGKIEDAYFYFTGFCENCKKN